MYKLDLPVDVKQTAAIQRRRAQEEERKGRIFNSKVRQIGVDQHALDQQIQDRKRMEEGERRREQAFGRQQQPKLGYSKRWQVKSSQVLYLSNNAVIYNTLQKSMVGILKFCNI